MGISELRHLGALEGFPHSEEGALDAELVRRGVISASDAALARVVHKQCNTSLDRVLIAEGLVSKQALLDAHARHFKSRQLTSSELMSYHPMQTELSPELMLRHAVLPVLDRDGRLALVCDEPSGRAAVLPHLPAYFADARALWAPRAVIQNRIASLHKMDLVQGAVTRVPAAESCRTWSQRRLLRLVAVITLLLSLVVLTVALPQIVFAAFAIWAIFTLVASALLKTAAFVAHRIAEPEPAARQADILSDRLPKVSILVPLFRETEILHALVARLTRLTYPKCLLDVVLVLEEEDETTREMLATIDLPPWIRPVVVPDGRPRTKPRAMNYALDFCEGEIIGIYDAEDAPDPDQIAQVALRFQQLPKDVVCIQGVLDFYNPKQNWLARCFTIEYSTWFRLILPGMSRLGFAIPLGGTTLFFRREALEQLGGWDSHNVTEDADLGFRLARHGYRTEMLATVTEEEANCLPWAWIKQRSRWLKGYMTTYLVHMRRPFLLWRQLGSWRFFGFQIHFVTALSQFLLAPVLWSFWLVIFGLPHPLDPVIPQPLMIWLGSAFLGIEVVNLTIYASGVADKRHRHLMPWTPTMHFYTPLGAVAAYKALYELVVKPFFWEKTRHGLSQKARNGKVKHTSDGAFDLT